MPKLAGSTGAMYSLLMTGRSKPHGVPERKAGMRSKLSTTPAVPMPSKASTLLS